MKKLELNQISFDNQQLDHKTKVKNFRGQTKTVTRL